MRWFASFVVFPLILLFPIACQSNSAPKPTGPARQNVEVPAATATETETETEPQPSASVPSRTPAPDPTSASRCENAIADLKAEVARAPGDCKADADCACYAGGPEPAHCGGVASRAIADRINELVNQIKREKCQAQGVACAAWRCAPRCDKGRCAR